MSLKIHIWAIVWIMEPDIVVSFLGHFEEIFVLSRHRHSSGAFWAWSFAPRARAALAPLRRWCSLPLGPWSLHSVSDSVRSAGILLSERALVIILLLRLLFFKSLMFLLSWLATHGYWSWRTTSSILFLALSRWIFRFISLNHDTNRYSEQDQQAYNCA